MMLFLAFLAGCNGCRPALPTDDQNNPDSETHETADSAPVDTAPDETADTSPPLPPRCDSLEVEPNNTLYQVEPLPMEQWLCGAYDKTDSPLGDIDFYGFEMVAGGWLMVSEEAASRGSSADAQFTIIDDDNSVTVFSGYLTTDPLIVIPVPDPHPFTLALGETSYSNGEDYNYALIASEVKPPVEWTFAETESNDTTATATEFPVEGTAYGTISRAGDLDWYHVTTPKSATDIVFTVEAYAHGSPLDTTVVLYAADGVTRLVTDYNGEVDYDPDPQFDYKQTEANSWYVLVKNGQDGGSGFHWYTLNITAVYGE